MDMLFFQNKYYLLLLIAIVGRSCTLRQAIPHEEISASNTVIVPEIDNPKNMQIFTMLDMDDSDDSDIQSFAIIDTVKGTINAHFDFSGISLEGGEGYASYNKNSNKIEKATVILYGEMRRNMIDYFFIDNNQIKVTTTIYNYLMPLSYQLLNDTDEIDEIDTIISHTIDLSNPSKDFSSEDSMILSKLKRIIPFQLNQ